MSRNLRQITGGVTILIFLVVYIGLALRVADHLPPNGLIQGLYFLVIGTAWGAPLIPLLSWMDKGR